MQTAPNKPQGAAASPAITANSLQEWFNQRDIIQSKLENEVYGIMPRSFTAKLMDSRLVADAAFNASAHIEEIKVQGAYTYKTKRGSSTSEREIIFNVVLLTPAESNGPSPIIVMENFCPNHSVVPVKDISKPKGDYFSCEGDSFMASVFGYFFGRYITTPPVEMIMKQGYAIAVVYPGEVFPDRKSALPLYRQTPDLDHPWGAIGAWAYQFSLITNYLDEDSRYSDVITYGHSRYGKSALLAAAFDPAIDGVIAHQSGTGGASLSKGKKGETVADITESYPHWFTPNYSEDALTIDQHHLLALIAPRPILLGNAKRDVWSDPEGAFKAAQGADSVYELYDTAGLQQKKLSDFQPEANLAFWIRPGTHGVVKEDWPAFLEFLNAHFK